MDLCLSVLYSLHTALNYNIGWAYMLEKWKKCNFFYVRFRICHHMLRSVLALRTLYKRVWGNIKCADTLKKYLLRLLSWLKFFVIRHLGQESVSNFSRQTFPKSSGSSYQENINYKRFLQKFKTRFNHVSRRPIQATSARESARSEWVVFCGQYTWVNRCEITCPPALHFCFVVTWSQCEREGSRIIDTRFLLIQWRWLGKRKWIF